MKKLKVAILGSGNLGTDLLTKVLRSPDLECAAMAGRNPDAMGFRLAAGLGVEVSFQGIDFLADNPDCYDLVFDATSQSAHLLHAPIFARQGKTCIDLTPAVIGAMCFPFVNLGTCLGHGDISMVGCGAQSAIPVIHALRSIHPQIQYLEVSTTLSTARTGPALLHNLQSSIRATEKAVSAFSGCLSSRAFLQLDPAYEACGEMRTAILSKVEKPDLSALKDAADRIASRMQARIPGYQVVVGPPAGKHWLEILIVVKDDANPFAPHAVNLEVMNRMAIEVAEAIARNRGMSKCGLSRSANGVS